MRGTNIKIAPPWLENIPLIRELFNQDMSHEKIQNKESEIIGDEALPIGRYIWNKHLDYIEYLPHDRGDSHGIIYKNGRHEHLRTLPQIGKVTEYKTKLRAELTKKGLLNLW